MTAWQKQPNPTHPAPAGMGGIMANGLARWWSARGKRIMQIAIALMVLVAAARFVIELWLLLGEPGLAGNHDLARV